mmetsp:Transcript_9414/g.14561  ORF Transcript_9414/g.14561 Transcript_9414/m.14561 type:complete len:89 (+) Transcript_9414:71-337(+)
MTSRAKRTPICKIMDLQRIYFFGGNLTMEKVIDCELDATCYKRYHLTTCDSWLAMFYFEQEEYSHEFRLKNAGQTVEKFSAKMEKHKS